MGKINWPRVFLCGLLTAAIAILLALPVFALTRVGSDVLAGFEAGGEAFPVLVPILHLAIGIWAMWLYAAIRPRYGPGPKTAALAGLAVWVFGALVAVLVGSYRLIPLGALVFLLAVSLPTTIVAVVVGAWPYKE